MNDNTYKVLDKINLAEWTFILRFERKNLQFKTGQHLGVGPANGLRTREYSVYSGENEEYIEILVKEITDGVISPQLANLNPGDELTVDTPDGNFELHLNGNPNQKHIFIATGTGIAPYHSFIKSNPQFNYQIIHGISTIAEAYGKSDYNPDHYLACTSKDNSGHFTGRVTQYIQQNPQGAEHKYYLCGNSNMIHDMYEILENQGVDFDNIHTEVYF